MLTLKGATIRVVIHSTADAHEVNLIISPQNSGKSTGLNSLLTKILNSY